MNYFAFGALLLQGASGQAGADQSCRLRPSPWSPSEILWSAPYDQHGPHPFSAAVSATSIYIAAANVVNLPTGSAGKTQAMIAVKFPRNGDKGVEIIPAPPGHVPLRWPRIAVDAKGMLHMAWLEPVKLPVTAKELIVYGVFGASYRRGHWTVEHLMDLTGISWGATGISDLIRSDNGDLHMLAPAFGANYVLYVVWRAGKWNAIKIPHRLGTAYTALATRHDSLFAGLITPSPQGEDGNSVFVMLSPNAGQTWMEQVMVSRSYNLSARELAVVPLRSGPIALVWGQIKRPDGFLAGVLRTSWSNDMAGPWSSPVNLDWSPLQLFVMSAIESEPGIVTTLFWSDAALTIARACDRAWGSVFSKRDTLRGTSDAVLVHPPGEAPQVFWSAFAGGDGQPARLLWLRSILH